MITAGLTCFNAEKSIIRALDSILQQNRKVSEVIIVDDCSNDSSTDLIREYISTYKGDTEIKLFANKTNNGFPSALNQIINNCTTEYLAFFDDDDLSFPTRLENQLNRLTQYESRFSKPVDVVCYGYREIVKVGKNEVDHIARSFGGSDPVPVGTEVVNYLLRIHAKHGLDWGDGVLGSCTLFARTSSLRKILFDERFRRGAEIDFAIRAGERNFHFISCKLPVIRMFKSLGNHKSSKIDLAFWLSIFKKHRNTFPGNSFYYKSICSLYKGYYLKNDRWILYGVYSTLFIFFHLLRIKASSK